MLPRRLILCVFVSAALTMAGPKVGDRAPEIHFDKIIPEQPAENASFPKLTGKTVVLEMWATWCGPCVAAIPHLNELADQFKDRPLVFLSVSNEEPEVVEYFLKKHPIHGLVGIAHQHDPLGDYGLEGIPGTFLIDAEGRIAGSLDPQTLTAGMLEAAMASRELPPVDRSMLPVPILPTEVIIRPHRDDPQSEVFKPPFENFHGSFAKRMLNSRTLNGYQLRTIVQMIWDFSPYRIEGDALQDHNSYDVYFSNPNATPETFRIWERDVITSAFRVKVTRETREMDVWVLSKLGSKPDSLKPVGTIRDFGHNGQLGHIVAPACPVSMIATMLEGPAGKPVIDETGIEGKFDFELAWTGAGEIRSIEAMRKAGFKVEAARRPLEYLIIERAN